MEPGEIDPVKYGVLWERVQNMDKILALSMIPEGVNPLGMSAPICK